MTNIIINGNHINGDLVGRQLIINNGKVFVDGKQIETNEKIINIKIEGDIDKLSCDVVERITVNGNVNNLQTSSGDVDITGNVTNGVSTSSGDVECGNITGNVKTSSGDVKCGNIIGNVNTMSGNIKHK